MSFVREFYLVSSLEKVLPNKEPRKLPSKTRLSAWPGTKAAIQLAYHIDGEDGTHVFQEIFSLEVSGGPCDAQIRKANLIPVENPCQPGADDFFISKDAGLYPDRLDILDNDYVHMVAKQYRALWISWNIPEDAKPGDYEIKIKVHSPVGRIIQSGAIDFCEDVEEYSPELSFVLSVGSVKLPESRMMHREFYYSDCLADYYNIDVFSEKYWEYLEKSLTTACTEHQISEVLCPMISIGMDEAPQASRTVVQLLDIEVVDGEYIVDYSKLERWLSICRKAGAKMIGTPQLFTQWGGTHTPRVWAKVDGKMEQIFGWHVKADDPAWRKFLVTVLPEYHKLCEKYGYDKDHITYTLTDEPAENQIADYRKAVEITSDLIQGGKLIESLKSTNFVKEGLVPYPEIPLNYVDEFIEAGINVTHAYYCVGQVVHNTPNRFVCMPSVRNRIIGVLCYIYNLQSICNWGYNFYNSTYSYYKIDPFKMDYAEWSFPACDGFMVYPGPNGESISSIRVEVLDDAFYDYRALQLLEELTSRDYVMSLILEEAKMKKMTWFVYPKDPDYLLGLRERLAKEIEDKLNK